MRIFGLVWLQDAVYIDIGGKGGRGAIGIDERAVCEDRTVD